MWKELITWVVEWFVYWKLALKMTMAIKLADIKQRAFNRQYHIMLLATKTGDKLVSVSRDDVLRLKRKKWLPKNFTMFDLSHSRSIFYSTPLSRNNKSTREERDKAREKYFRYMKG